jgi:hypothetical protein
MFFTFKIIFSGIIIAFASWLAGRKPILAGFIIALPLMSMLSILFTYSEYKDMAKINQFATSILFAVPLSLTFFVPFLLNKWIKLNFAATYCLALACLAGAYFLHSWIARSFLR